MLMFAMLKMIETIPNLPEAVQTKVLLAQDSYENEYHSPSIGMQAIIEKMGQKAVDTYKKMRDIREMKKLQINNIERRLKMNYELNLNKF